MQYSGPTDPVERALWLRARRGVARRHHPDIGGDANELRRQLDAVDREFMNRSPHQDPSPGPSRPRRPNTSVLRPSDEWASLNIEAQPLLGQRLHRVINQSRRTIRRTEKAVRTRIPPGWPGSRRYFDI